METEKRLVNILPFVEELGSTIIKSRLKFINNPAMQNVIDLLELTLRRALEQPTVDVAEVVHGYVLPADDPKYVLLDRKCGICDQLMLATDNYCPMCGAKNEGER